jgi:hypothetical protein
MRKKRNDRNYVLYSFRCEDTGDSYIGLTVASGRAFLRSVKVRVQKHWSRANRESKGWKLYNFLRENSESEYSYEVLEVIRGRKNAYQREREYIYYYEPSLNTF